MYTQRFYLLIIIWFLIHLFSITTIQCKRHRRSLDQHYIQQTRPIIHSYPPSFIPIRKKKSKPFKLQRVDSLKFNLDSTSDSYPTFKVKLNPSFKLQSINSITLPIINNLPKHLYNSSLIIIDENNSTKETLNTSSDLKTSTENFVDVESTTKTEVKQFTKVESSTLITDLSSTSIRADKIFTEFEENPKILRLKRFTKNDFLIKNSYDNSVPEKKTLLGLEGPSILEDLESSLDQGNLIHVRVKRDNPNEDNIVPSLKSNYFKDLAASFPKSEHELKEDQLASIASNEVEDERLFKRSSGLENEDNLHNPCDAKLNENAGNQRNLRFQENCRLQQKNLYSDLEDEALKLGKKKYNYVKDYPEYYSVKDEADDYQRENIGEDSSNEYVNDNEGALENPYQGDNKVIDLMLPNMNYEALNGDYFEKIDQQNIQNDTSKNEQNLFSDDLYSSEVLQPEQQREMKFDSDSVESEFVNSDDIKNLKCAALEEASMYFPKREVRLKALFKNRRRRTPLKKAHRKKSLMKNKKKTKKLNKILKKKRGRKNSKSLKKHSKMQKNLTQLDKVVDDGQVESKIEKSDSSDSRSEVDILRRDISNVIKLKDSDKFRSSNLSPNDENFETIHRDNNGDENKEVVYRSKRDVQNLQKSLTAKDLNKSLKRIQKSLNLKERVSRNKNIGNQRIRPIDHKKRKLKVTHETETLNQKNTSKFNVEHRATESATKSVEEIKTIVDKLVTKVNDLHNFIGINGNTCEGKKTEIKNNSELMLIPKTIERCMILEKSGNITSKVATKSKLSTEMDQLLRDSRDQKQKKILKRKRKADLNQLVQLKPEEIKKRKSFRRKRKLHRKWDMWTDWSSCSVTCGKGRQIRWRHCIRDCHVAETEMEEKTCQLPACPPGNFLGIF